MLMVTGVSRGFAFNLFSFLMAVKGFTVFKILLVLALPQLIYVCHSYFYA